MCNDVLRRFEDAWQSGARPALDTFLPPLAAAAVMRMDSARRELLHELIKLDLEYRCRDSADHERTRQLNGPCATKGPRLEEYLARYPELGPADQPPLDLIGWEYLVRRRCGDPGGHADYFARFPRLGARLLEELRAVDAEQDAESDPAAGAGAADGEWTAKLGGPGPAAAPASAAALVEAVRQFQLLSAAQLAEVTRDLQGRFPETRDLARELLARDWLTPYQVNHLLRGGGAELRLGPYILLQRLGEGGMGQVFKARHEKMERVMALKILHKDLVADREAAARFRREIEVLSRLDHPNVVHAYDAGPGGPSYYLAMEYVEGTDLARLVKQGGRLPVMQACAYIRQAALGLQHTHERGLVHRDIKPHNLILSLQEGLIKVADLGLARLPRPADAEATAALGGLSTGTLTPAGAVLLGTADYLAPEQALDFHRADIRADIYSLGCTLFFLLTGQPPFPAATLAEKLLSHQSKEPPAIEKLRPDVPAGLARVLRRMLAKRPEDRYQAPAEAAAAVTPYICSPDARDLEFDPSGWSVRAGAYTTWAMLCKFARRNKAFTAAVLTAMFLLAWSALFNYQARRQLQREQDEKDRRTREAVPAFVEAAQMSAVRQDLTRALELVNLALYYNPDDAPARLLKGQMLIAQQNFAKAEAELGRYLQLNPADHEAEELLRLSRAVDPQDGERLVKLLGVLQRQKAFGPAACLAQELTRRRLALHKLLPYWQNHIDKAWPGLGKNLGLPADSYQFAVNFQERRLDLTVLKDLPLSRLYLYNCGGVTDLAPLKDMPRTLTELDVGRCGRLNGDLTPLTGMPLTNLKLGYCGNVKNLEPLRGMPLTYLDLSGCNKVTDLTPLSQLPLTTLYISSCASFTLTPLKDLKLTALDIAYTQIRDLTPLRGMKLAYLNMWDCPALTDLTPLQGMDLEKVGLTPRHIRKGMDVLRQLRKLKTISISWDRTFASDEFWAKYDAGAFAK